MNNSEKIKISAAIDIRPETITAAVNSAKQKYGADERGVYRIDTADILGQMISNFLGAHDFDAWVKNPENCP